MSGDGPLPAKSGEYAERGDYHRAPDQTWDYLPTYLAKLEYVRGYLHRARPPARGCSTPAAARACSSRSSRAGWPSKASIPTTSRRTCDAPRSSRCRMRTAASSARSASTCWSTSPTRTSRRRSPSCTACWRRDGELLVSVPNLAHLQSRVHFLLTGRLIRTASEVKHPGDRPLAEYLRLFDRAGFAVVERARRSSRRCRCSPPGSGGSPPSAPGCIARSPACCRCRPGVPAIVTLETEAHGGIARRLY